MKKKMRQAPESSEESDTEINSDEELQEAFEKGLLKPGLNVATTESRKFVNNAVMMKSKLADLKLNLEWVERLDLSTALDTIADNILADKEKIEPKYKVETPGDKIVDDLQRETLFYRQAQEAALVGLSRLKALGIPTKRPDDYFAQMAKSDDHMLKVKQRVLTQQASQEKSQKVKKLRELKKYGKKVQIEVGLQRAKEKRELLSKVKQYRDGKLDSLDFLDEGKGKKKDMVSITKEKTKEHNANKRVKGGKLKRQAKEKKFGFGGKKSGSKRNNFKESEDGRSGRGGGGAGGKKPKSASARPGKSKRQAAKNKGGRGKR
nr:EOG090X0D84 [Sida crystallina]